MNYQRIYDDIIDRAVTRHRPEDYAERHHIVPKYMGGSDDTDNLVYLTGREHYLCHWLLYKIHKNSKSAYAWNLMSINSYSNSSRYTSKTFEYAKVAAARHKSKDMTGDKTPCTVYLVNIKVYLDLKVLKLEYLKLERSLYYLKKV